MFKLLRNLKTFKFSIIFVMILVFIQSITELYLPTLLADIVDLGIVKGDTNYILRVGLVMLLVAATGTIAAITASYLSAKVGIGFSKLVRQKIFTKVESFSLEEFDKIGTSSLVNRTTNDITQVEKVLIAILRMFIRAPFMAIGGIILAISKDKQLTLVLVGVMLLLIIIISIIAKFSMPLFKSQQVKLDQLNLVLRERLTGIRVIRAFNKKMKRKYDLIRQIVI